ALEAGHERGVLGEVLGQQLHCHAALQTQVGRDVNGRHAAEPQSAFQAVAPADRNGAHLPPSGRAPPGPPLPPALPPLPPPSPSWPPPFPSPAPPAPAPSASLGCSPPAPGAGVPPPFSGVVEVLVVGEVCVGVVSGTAGAVVVVSGAEVLVAVVWVSGCR